MKYSCKHVFLAVFFIAVLFSCKKEVELGSGDADIINFYVKTTNVFTSEQVSIDKDYKNIHIFSSSNIDSTIFPLSLIPQIEVSEGASITPESGVVVELIDRNGFVQYSTKSEDENTNLEWFALVRDKQIPNSDFEDWHTRVGMNSIEFFEPGRHAETTVWATANMGTSTYGVYGTSRLEENGNVMAKVSTGKTSLIPVTSGTLFLGRFDIAGAIQNPTDPEKATDFGIPFIYKPFALKFKYMYKAGDQLIDATLKNPTNLFGGFSVDSINGKDEFNIAAFIESRDKQTVTEIARVEFRAGDTDTLLIEKVLEFNYSSSAAPTHITIVFASSADGDLWKGAVGSTLIIDDLELLYE